MSSLNTQSASDRLKAGLLRAIRPRNDENSSDQITQKNTIIRRFESFYQQVLKFFPENLKSLRILSNFRGYFSQSL